MHDQAFRDKAALNEILSHAKKFLGLADCYPYVITLMVSIGFTDQASSSKQDCKDLRPSKPLLLGGGLAKSEKNLH